MHLKNYCLFLILIWQYRFHTSYGWYGIWDWIHGTDDKFDKSTMHRLYGPQSVSGG